MPARREDEVIVPCPFGCPYRLRFPWKPHNLLVTCPACKQSFTWTPLGIVYDERFEEAKGNRRRGKRYVRPFATALVILIVVGLVGTLALHPAAPVSDVPPSEESHASEPPNAAELGATAPSSTNAQQGVEAQPAEPIVVEERRPPNVRVVTKPLETPEPSLPILLPPPSPPTRYESSYAEPLYWGYRLPNGTHIEPPSLTGGRSILHIENGTAHDVAVKLVQRQEEMNVLARFVYIRSGERVLLKDIEQGIYLLAWCSGSDWNPSTKRFEQPQGCFAFEKPLVFTEGVTREGEYLKQQYTVMRVTLHAVIGGNMTRQPISDETFDSL